MSDAYKTTLELDHPGVIVDRTEGRQWADIIERLIQEKVSPREVLWKFRIELNDDLQEGDLDEFEDE